MRLHYEQPKITNYGTMKKLTHASSGSGGDSIANSLVGRSKEHNAFGTGLPGGTGTDKPTQPNDNMNTLKD